MTRAPVPQKPLSVIAIGLGNIITHPRAVSGQESRRRWRTRQELSKSDCVEIYVNTHLDWALPVGGVPSSALPLVLQRR